MAGQRNDQEELSFKDTLNLPSTDFPIRAESSKNDPLMNERWKNEQLFTKATNANKGNDKYILHDGPPYANGHIHLGHAYNKILKDILTKSYRMSGFHVPVKPGWDCHGLPIELKVTEQFPGLEPQQLKAQCRAYAQSWVDIQREEFKKLGVLMDWDNPYLTMNFAYESTIVKSFGTLVEKGYIERKNKTVAWCMYDKTVLAAAEIEYKDRKDPSLYVLFETVHNARLEKLFGTTKPINIVVWTTTPWTLPLNRAVLAKKGAEYVLIEINDQLVLIGAARAQKLVELLNLEYKELARIKAEELEGVLVHHPFEYERHVPLILDESVGEDEGTAFVHCAPGCGPLDYEIGVKHGLEIYAPISPDGKYSDECYPKDLAGMSVVDGQIWVIKALAAQKKIAYKTTLTHSYPHCWRCRNGLIFRATRQWFFDLKHLAVKDKALELVQQMTFLPAAGKNFLRATIENRWEWCLSRQRVWGVPIPALLCKECDHAVTDVALINKVAEHIAQQGVEYWDTVPVEKLLKENQTCQKCGSAQFKKEKDILDVWFDAGVSHQAVLAADPNLAFPADMYLEGVDQHRGWFQSSLLTATALTGQTCTKRIMTHGFTVDAQGQKMSKSLGNVVAPDEIIAKLGTDGLRLWVASIGHEGDAVVSDVLLSTIGEMFRKIRNTCRGLLMNLYDFDASKDMVAVDKLQYIDKAMLHQISRLNRELIARYQAGDFSAVMRKISDFCAVEISSLYLDCSKDRLYTEKADSLKRRSAQTVIWYTLDALTKLIAPIMSFTAEQLSDYAQKHKEQSIHLQHFVSLPDPYALEHDILGSYEKELSPALVGSVFEASRHMQEVEAVRNQEHTWQVLVSIRAAVLKAIEPLRAQGTIKQSMEAQVAIHVQPTSPYYGAFKTWLDEIGSTHEKTQEILKELCVVSLVKLVDSEAGLERTNLEGVLVKVTHADGVKCPRCWQWDLSQRADHLCTRCQGVLGL